MYHRTKYIKWEIKRWQRKWIMVIVQDNMYALSNKQWIMWFCIVSYLMPCWKRDVNIHTLLQTLDLAFLALKHLQNVSLVVKVTIGDLRGQEDLWRWAQSSKAIGSEMQVCVTANSWLHHDPSFQSQEALCEISLSPTGLWMPTMHHKEAGTPKPAFSSVGRCQS